MTATRSTPRTFGVGGAVFLVVTVLIAAMTAFILFVPIDGNDFEVTTGLSWAAFEGSNPDAADYLRREARLLAIGFLGMSLFAASIAWTTFRRDDPSLGLVLWLFPLALMGSALVLIAGDGVGLGVVYLAVGAMASAALAMALRQKSP